jgi:hypothetical protein
MRTEIKREYGENVVDYEITITPDSSEDSVEQIQLDDETIYVAFLTLKSFKRFMILHKPYQRIGKSSGGEMDFTTSIKKNSLKIYYTTKDDLTFVVGYKSSF